jgi:hypothetical protein
MPPHPESAAREPAATRRVTYPGELAAAPTELALDIPAGWRVSPVRGALAVARAPVCGPSGFHANLVVSVDRVARDVTLSTVAGAVLADARERSERLVVLAEAITEVDEVPALTRHQLVEVTGAPTPLLQLVVLLVVDVAGGEVRDVVQCTVTGEQRERDALQDAFDALVVSITLGERARAA